MKFKSLINIKKPKSMIFYDLNIQSQSFIRLINVKMPTIVKMPIIVGILTFMSRINFMPLSRVEHEKRFITSECDTFEFIVCLPCNTPDRLQRKTFLTTDGRIFYCKSSLIMEISPCEN